MKRIAQFRYYGKSKDELNYHPAYGHVDSDNYFELLTKGFLFDNFKGISKLGIQCRPNTKFYLNNSNYPIVIGNTGIYELDLENHGQINNIHFDGAVLEGLDGDRLLIDIVYESQGVVQ